MPKSTPKNNSNFGQTVTPNEGGKKTKGKLNLPKPRVLSIALLASGVILVAFVAGFLIKYLPNYLHERDKEQVNELIAQASSLESEGKYDQAHQIWIDYLNGKPNKEFKFNAMLNLGNTYYNNKQYKEALEWYIKARDYKGENTLASSQAIASAAERLGDKPLAIEYYRLAIDETREFKKTFSSEDLYQAELDNEIVVYERAINELNAQ